jgi:hypothetical protein
VSNSLKVTRLKLKFLFLNTWKQLKQEQNSHLILNLRNFFWWFIDMHKQKLYRLLKCVRKFYAKNDLSIECSNKMSTVVTTKLQMQPFLFSHSSLIQAGLFTEIYIRRFFFLSKFSDWKISSELTATLRWNYLLKYIFCTLLSDKWLMNVK